MKRGKKGSSIKFLEKISDFNRVFVCVRTFKSRELLFFFSKKEKRMSVEEPSEIIRVDMRSGSKSPYLFTLKDDNGHVLGSVEFFVKDGLAMLSSLSYPSLKVGQNLLRNLFNEDNHLYNCFGIYSNTASVQDLFLFCVATRNCSGAGTERDYLVLAENVKLPEMSIRYLQTEVEEVYKDLVEIFTNKTANYTPKGLCGKEFRHGSELVAILRGDYLYLEKKDTTIFERIIVFAVFLKRMLIFNDTDRIRFAAPELWENGEPLFVRAVMSRLGLVGRTSC